MYNQYCKYVDKDLGRCEFTYVPTWFWMLWVLIAVVAVSVMFLVFLSFWLKKRRNTASEENTAPEENKERIV